MRDRGLTFNALDPQLGKRIDYAFVATDNAHFTLRDVDLLPLTGHYQPAASDHLGLLLTLSKRK